MQQAYAGRYFFSEIGEKHEIAMYTIFYINYAIILIVKTRRIIYNNLNECDPHLTRTKQSGAL